ncbi:uncharacterized protein LOC120342430 [Styela clava]
MTFLAQSEAISFTISLGIYKLTAIGSPHPKVIYETARTECAKTQSRILKLTSATKSLIKGHLNSDHFGPDDKLWLANTGSTCYSFSLSDFTSRTTYCTDKHYYICEQAGPHDMQLSQTNFIVTSYTGKKEITCMVSGFPPPTVKWMKGNIVLTSTPLNNQFKNGQKLVLGLKQLTIADEGQYRCFASNTVGQNPHSVSGILNIQVPSQPSIINITSSPCNSNLLVNWKPHVLGIGIEHRFRIVDTLNSSNYRDSFTTPNNVSIGSNVADLQPSTSYIIKIEPCLTTPPTCFSHYATTTHATTGGLPGRVSKPSLKMTFDGSCNVSWSIVMNPKYISDYKLVISSTKAIVSSYYKDDVKMNEMLLPSHITSYVLPKNFNRKYNVSIQAKTCAGFGPKSKAVGECATDTNAPSNIQTPTTIDKMSNSGILGFSINIPDETNGPISCYFIIVQLNETSETLPDFNNVRMSKLNNSEIEDEYIAIALNRTSVGHNRPKISLILGDQVKTRCDISGNNNSGNGNNSKNTYAAYNKRLSLDETHRIFLVTSTPTKEGVSFGVSDALVVGKQLADEWKTFLIIGLTVVVFILLAVVIFFTVRQRTKSNKKIDQIVQYRNNEQVEEEEIPSTNVPLSNFEDYYRNLFHNEKALFREQFKRIKIESKANMKSTTFASAPELKRKNRYRNILPYDETRVWIKANDTGYINACYVNGYAKSRKYIATQGPLPTTVDDFWLMVVEQECKVIVMLAKCFEAGKKKCQKYWPDYGITSSFGVVKVFNSEEVKYSGFVRRIFQVETNDGNIAMEVLQYQYVNWPDHDIPFTTSNLVRMHKLVIQCSEEFGDDTPMIVHCSAGAGRTGTFIGYDYLLEEGRDTGNVDVLQCVLKMRSQRVDMIQNSDQYILLHKLILENYLFKNTDYNAQDIGHKFQEITSHEKRREFRDEFEKLSILEPLKCSKLIGRRYENRRYNISDDVIPYDHNAVVLIMCNNEARVPYVNASWIETYDESTSMIAAQAPMNEGIPFFWRSVLDNRVNTIIMLACVEECIQYWPHDVRATLSMENVSVTLMEENINGSISRRNFKVFRGNQQTHVTQIQYSGWSNEQCPEDGSIVLDIIGEMQRNTRSLQGSACLIHCTDGAGRTGAFCAIANLIERLKHENKVDVFRAVKDLRDCKQGMVQTLEQYKFCHTAICNYMKSFEIYSNFENK